MNIGLPMNVNFQKLIGMDTAMSITIIFQNKYWYGYSSIQLGPVPFPSLCLALYLSAVCFPQEGLQRDS